MGRKVKERDSYKFKKGERLHLDDIYNVQGIGGNDWWDHEDGEESCEIIITRDVHFEITIYK